MTRQNAADESDTGQNASHIQDAFRSLHYVAEATCRPPLIPIVTTISAPHFGDRPHVTWGLKKCAKDAPLFRCYSQLSLEWQKMRIQCGVYLPRKRNATFSDEAISAGLRPEDVLVYVEKCAEESEAFGRQVAQQRRSRPQGPAAQGRGNRPYQKVSYVGRKNAAH